MHAEAHGVGASARGSSPWGPLGTVAPMPADATTTAPHPLVDDLDALPFDNRFTAALPADPDPDNRRRQVHGALYSRVRPTPVAAPVTLAWSPEIADLLGLDPAVCASDDFAQVFAGN